MRADHVATTLPRGAWQRHSAGSGAKGPRPYDWALVEIDADQPGHRWLLVRRNSTTGELAYYGCYSPQPVRRYPRWSPWPGAAGPSKRASDRQRVVRPGRAPSLALGLLAAVDHPVHRRPRVPGRPRSTRTINTDRPRRSDPDHLQRDPAPADQADRPASPQPATLPCLVHLVQKTPAPCPNLPLQATNSLSTMTTTKSGWSTRCRLHLRCRLGLRFAHLA